MKPIDAKSSIYIYIDFDVENNDKDCKFKVADHMKIFVKCYAPNWSEEDFVNNKRARNTVPQTYVIDNLNQEKVLGTFHVKELQKQIKQN